jgi:hypothetical protein
LDFGLEDEKKKRNTNNAKRNRMARIKLESSKLDYVELI